MSDNVRRDNRRALPKYLLTILLFGLLGGVLGFFTGVAGAAGVAETVRQALDRVLAVCAPWGIVGSAVVLPHPASGAGAGQWPERPRQGWRKSAGWRQSRWCCPGAGIPAAADAGAA